MSNNEEKNGSGSGPGPMVAVPAAYLAGLQDKVKELSSQVEMLGGYTRLTLPLMNGARFLYNVKHAEVAIDTLEIHINPARLVMSAAEVMSCLGQPGIDLDNSLMFELNPRAPEVVKRLKSGRAELARRQKLAALTERRSEILALRNGNSGEVSETEKMLAGVDAEIARLSAQVQQPPRKERPNLLILPGGAGSDDSKS